MLTLKQIRDDKEFAIARLAVKGVDAAATIDQICALDDARKEQQQTHAIHHPHNNYHTLRKHRRMFCEYCQKQQSRHTSKICRFPCQQLHQFLRCQQTYQHKYYAKTNRT